MIRIAAVERRPPARQIAPFAPSRRALEMQKILFNSYNRHIR